MTDFKTPPRRQFAISMRLLHWLMAAMILAMLFIGAAMVASLGSYHTLLAIHRPLGIAIFVVAAVRFVNRQLNPLPPFLATMSPAERFVASWSEKLMYALMFALPLVGWAMLSAARYPIHMAGPVYLPPILPKNMAVYTVLRKTHTVLAYGFFFVFLAHLGGVLFHTIVIRDGLLKRMVPWKAEPPIGTNDAHAVKSTLDAV